MLENETDAKGRKFEVTKLYLPPPLYYSEEDVKSLDVTNNERLANERLAASYVNFYICNEAVICPAFGGQAQETDIRSQISALPSSLHGLSKIIFSPSTKIEASNLTMIA